MEQVYSFKPPNKAPAVPEPVWSNGVVNYPKKHAPTRLYPTCVTLPNLVVLHQTIGAYNRLKKLTPRVPPFKVTQGHRNRHGSIGDL